MEPSSDNMPFYSSFGNFEQGYNREEAKAGMNNAFRLYQRQRRGQDRYLKELMLGTGLGVAAEKSVQDGIYEPQAALHTSSNGPIAAEAVVLDSTTKTIASDSKKNEEGTSGKKSSVAEMERLGTFPINLMKEFTKAEVKVQSLKEVEQQLKENIAVAEKSIADLCNPFTFDVILDSLSTALSIVEDGDAKIQVKLSIQEEEEEKLEGAEAVMEFAQKYITPIVLSLVTTLHATEWMLQYTMTFINSLSAKDEEEAYLQLELLAQCVRWLGKIDQFVAFSTALELKWEVYEAFSQLRDSAEEHIGSVLDSIEDDLNTVLLESFPKRRQVLLLHEGGIRERLQKVLTFLHDIESNWLPDVQLQREWKDEFLTRMLHRIHTVIAPGFLSASLGFIDESLYKLVPDDTAVGRSTQSASRRHGQSPPMVSTATQVETRRVTEELNFQQIAVSVKGSASRVVGIQLCMAARFVLRQCDAEYDKKWGFSMSNSPDAYDPVTNAAGEITRFTNSMQQRARERASQQMDALRYFFL
ncbi:uncharacterized protein TM35_000015930 [Trypanosoma theileri]|uniref:Uncharacterized protein n=1 Tax=Trypanosoma theileri TaxID=67003 RepID=A0A1X0P9X4_9TRYP|nr:uncharacterized protein TM35_000015930 [Trypanosoma theileri]ORC93716.1 hypothetical protein TM35_000015930 [Trypanosoma theileri]